jgi:hypothetical protein
LSRDVFRGAEAGDLGNVGGDDVVVVVASVLDLVERATLALEVLTAGLATMSC